MTKITSVEHMFNIFKCECVFKWNQIRIYLITYTYTYIFSVRLITQISTGDDFLFLDWILSYSYAQLGMFIHVIATKTKKEKEGLREWWYINIKQKNKKDQGLRTKEEISKFVRSFSTQYVVKHICSVQVFSSYK